MCCMRLDGATNRMHATQVPPAVSRAPAASLASSSPRHQSRRRRHPACSQSAPAAPCTAGRVESRCPEPGGAHTQYSSLVRACSQHRGSTGAAQGQHRGSTGAALHAGECGSMHAMWLQGVGPAQLQYTTGPADDGGVHPCSTHATECNTRSQQTRSPHMLTFDQHLSPPHAKPTLAMHPNRPCVYSFSSL